MKGLTPLSARTSNVFLSSKLNLRRPVALPRPSLRRPSGPGSGSLRRPGGGGRNSAGRRTVVGLDVEPGHLAVAEVRQTDGRLAIERGVTAPLAPGIMRDGEVIDVEGLAAALSEVWARHRLPKAVRLGVANQRIVVRSVDLPVLSDPKELDAAARFHASELIPMPLDQAVFEHQAVGTVETPEGPRTRVVLVAARRDMVERHLAAARSAGLRPVGVDLSAFAMIRALDGPQVRAYDMEAVLYVSIAGMTNLALAEGTRCLFTRVVPGGVGLLAQQLAERRELTLDEAHAWLCRVGLDVPEDEVDGDRAVVTEARQILIEGVRRIADDVRNSLDFYRSQNPAAVVATAVLTGPAVAIPGLPAALGAEAGLEVVPGIVPEVGDASLSPTELGRLSIAAGLAVEERAA